ncbi:MAG: hypothetical protein JWR90_100 [Marmoricola sp.]|jgi:uncharacterized protein (TIGR03083 family)|nr:hypothetical protein [Marmoricola sp.]
MEADEVWQTIDQQRSELADLMDELTDHEWQTPSLCTGWRVREVGAHLTLAQMTLLAAIGPTLRARGSFDRMIHQTAVRRAELPVGDYPVLLRAMVGSRRKAPFVSDVEPLIDQLVHGQDMAVPLGRTREMPIAAATVATQRAWSMGFPFRAGKRLHGFTLTATDARWTVGEGPVVEAPIRVLLMLVTGRDVVLPELGGPGAGRIRSRLADAVR